MNNRPKSITIISWIMIILGVISLITTIFTLRNPELKSQSEELMKLNPLPLSVQYVIMYLGLLITFVSGIAILRGKNWGRFLYVGWNGLIYVYGIITSPAKGTMIPGILFFLVIAFFLFRPKADAYFNAEVKND